MKYFDQNRQLTGRRPFGNRKGYSLIEAISMIFILGSLMSFAAVAVHQVDAARCAGRIGEQGARVDAIGGQRGANEAAVVVVANVADEGHVIP